MNSHFDAELGAALLGFNGEAVLYCQGISDTVAQEYAMDYARMLQDRAKGFEFSLPRIPHGRRDRLYFDGPRTQPDHRARGLPFRRIDPVIRGGNRGLALPSETPDSASPYNEECAQFSFS